MRDGTLGKPTETYGEEGEDEDDESSESQVVATIEALCVIASVAKQTRTRYFK